MSGFDSERVEALCRKQVFSADLDANDVTELAVLAHQMLERLQVDPSGTDQIDELEQAIQFLQHGKTLVEMARDSYAETAAQYEDEIEALKDRPPMACYTCEQHNDMLADELRVLRPVYLAASVMRVFPVPFDQHWELVGTVDAARDYFEQARMTDEERAAYEDRVWPQLERWMRHVSGCECDDEPHAAYCPARVR